MDAYEELSYYIRHMDARHKNIDAIFEMLGHIDVANLAPRIKEETYMCLLP